MSSPSGVPSTMTGSGGGGGGSSSTTSTPTSTTTPTTSSATSVTTAATKPSATATTASTTSASTSLAPSSRAEDATRRLSAEIDRDQFILLNVGGELINTSRQTLTLDSNSVLGRMFAQDANIGCKRDAGGAVLIDRDPRYFRVLLNFLRYGKLILDEGINLEGVREEAEFFQLKSLAQAIRNYKRPDLTRSQLIAQRGTITSFEGVRLMGCDLAHLSFTEERFNKARLERADLTDTNLSSAVFVKSCLTRALFVDADLRYAKFSECDLVGCVFRHADLPYANFTAVNLTNASLRDSFCAGTLFQKSCMRSTDFTGAVLMQAKFQECDLRNAILLPREYAGENRYLNVHFTGADIRGALVNWTEVGKLEQALFRHAKVTEEQYRQIPLPDEQKVLLELDVIKDSGQVSHDDTTDTDTY